MFKNSMLNNTRH